AALTSSTLGPDLAFIYDGARRALHSFPTRRSSDLDADVEPIVGSRPAALIRLRLPHPEAGLGNKHAGPGQRARFQKITTIAVSRSEEHTTELQSRGHILCRLFLENKNAKNWSRSAT